MHWGCGRPPAGFEPAILGHAFANVMTRWDAMVSGKPCEVVMGLARVTSQDVLQALVRELLSDDVLARCVRELI